MNRAHLRETSARVALRTGSRTSMQRSNFSMPGRWATVAILSAGMMSCTCAATHHRRKLSVIRALVGASGLCQGCLTPGVHRRYLRGSESSLLPSHMCGHKSECIH